MKFNSNCMKIGIVGGSIAGCSAAILLQKEGHDVTVFERSGKELVGRGGGIGTLPSVIQTLQEDGLLEENFPAFHVSGVPMTGKHPDWEPFGKIAATIPMNFSVFQWNAIWRSLRKRVPDPCYRAGIQIVQAQRIAGGMVELTTAEGKKESFDLVLFADGYNSLGRSLLFPENSLQYRGYVLWRGLLPESELEENDRLENRILRISYSGSPGHNVVYFIPDPDGSTQKGERVLNWAAYLAVPEDQLDQIMTDKNGRLRTGTMPPGKMHPDTESKLKELLSSSMPAFYAEMVNKTPDSYIQVIYTQDLDAYYKDRMCLIGDAGIVVQPFTGSGVFKGYHNVKDLISAFHEHENLEDALAHWSEKQIRSGKRLLAFGEQAEKAFIWDQPDFSRIDERSTLEWWKSSITFPEHFNYQKG